jgi:hypothetical protein
MTTPISPPDSKQQDPLGLVRASTRPYAGMGRRSVWRRRIKELPLRPSTCFHLMSRICDGLPFFDDTDKEALVIVLRKLARFSGIKLLPTASWAITSTPWSGCRSGSSG